MTEEQYKKYFDGKSHEYIIRERDNFIKKERIRQDALIQQEKMKQRNKNILISKKNSIVKNFIKNENADNRLYYFRFKFKNKIYYKIGITSQTLKDRYGKDYQKIDKILYDEHIDGALKIEQKLKEQFKTDIFPLKYFNDGGHTEIFDRDVLELDK